ncbi:twin-arginine translocation signal domain-containing protein [Natrinema sp. 74]|uniref:twin-arginine translocation signal domain-containing protein n=1 Tax=Natrinema sp. 74 TaxID=3384159 RepID=UPI0038D4E9B2
MRSNGYAFDRRSFLKKATAAGAVGTGLVAGAGTASASQCHYITVEGKQDGTSYSIELESWDDPSLGYNAESSGDSASGSTVSGNVNADKRDSFSYDGSTFQSVQVDGEAVIKATSDCGNQVSAVPPTVQLDISGNGSYTVGYWNSLSGSNLESGDVETCYPTYSMTGDPQLTCEFDTEGVVTGEVTYSDGTTREYKFGTGEVSGHQYTDTYEAAYEEGGPAYLHLDGDVHVDVTEI